MDAEHKEKVTEDGRERVGSKMMCGRVLETWVSLYLREHG